MHELTPLIKDLAIMLGIASVVVLLFQKIRQPVIFGYIVAGVIIGTCLPNVIESNVSQIETLSELGIIFLMFVLGLDFSFHKLKHTGFSATITGIFKIIAVTTLGFAVGKLMRWSLYDSLFLGAALAVSSTTIVIKILSELNFLGKRFAAIVFGVLVIEDLLAVLMLTVLSTVVTAKIILPFDIFLITAKLLLVVGGWFLSGYFIVPILFRRVIKYASQETLTIVSIAFCLMLVVTAAYFHYSTGLGAFIMGSILAETPLAAHIKRLISPLRDVFAAVFFISIGMLINTKILIQQWHIVLAISIFTIISKILITSIGSFLSGQNLNTSLRAGLSMPPVGEFSFIIVGLGIALNVINNSLYQIIVGTAAVTILVTPFLIKLSSNISNKIEGGISENFRNFLERYSVRVNCILVGYRRKLIYRKFIIGFVINGIIIAVIFTLICDFILPQITNLTVSANISEVLCWVSAIILSSPFIWGMLFAFKPIFSRNKTKRLLLIILGGIIAGAEIIALNIAYLQTWYIALVTPVITIAFLGLFYQQLEKIYSLLELRLENSLQEKNKRRSKPKERAPWETHLVEVIATKDFPISLVGKTLGEAQLKQKFGVNIVAIRRKNRLILAPKKSEKIFAQDKLVVLGNDEQIDSFKCSSEEALFS